MHPNTSAVAGGRANRYYFENVIGYPLETTLAIGSLIFGGVLERFPELKVVAAHGGGFIPYQVGRLDHVRQVRSEGSGLVLRAPSEYLSRLYFDSLTHSPVALAYLVSLVGADHVVVGTDHPFDMGEDRPEELISAVAGLSERDRAAILSGNAVRLLGMK